MNMAANLRRITCQASPPVTKQSRCVSALHVDNVAFKKMEMVVVVVVCVCVCVCVCRGGGGGVLSHVASA